MASSELAVGDRVETTKTIRLHTHDGVFEQPAGLVGRVTAIWDDQIRVDVGAGRSYNIGLRPDEFAVRGDH